MPPVTHLPPGLSWSSRWFQAKPRRRVLQGLPVRPELRWFQEAERPVFRPVRREKLPLRAVELGPQADRAQPHSVGQARVELD